MQKDASKLLKHIKENIGFIETSMPNNYNSLAICILDDVYSLRSKYFSITLPTIQRFANEYLNGDMYSSNYSIDNFIEDLDKNGLIYVSDYILKNKQKLCGRCKIDICYDVALKLKKINIQNFDDFNNYPNRDYLAFYLKQIKGIGDAAIKYLFMLAGDETLIKPDVHIHKCIKDAIGRDCSNDYCQELFCEVSAHLMKSKPYATPKFLDRLVWMHYSTK